MRHLTADSWYMPRAAWLFAPLDDRGAGTPARNQDDAKTSLASSSPSSTLTIGGYSVPALLTRLQSSDRDALGTLYTVLAESLTRLALLRTRSLPVAQEIVQDVFLALWLHREKLSADTDIHVYLAAAVRNRTRNIRDHDAVVVATEDAIHRETIAVPALGQPMPTPDVVTESEEFYAAYRRALTALTERERAAVLLRWEEGFTFERVARALGVSTVGARGIVLRAQQKVQAELAQYRD